MRRFYVTGEELSRYVTFEGVARVGVKSRPPAEFTPPPLPMDFTVGLLVEAESVEPHNYFGFTVENMADGILVAGGGVEERLNTVARIVEGASKLGWHLIAATHRDMSPIKALVPGARLYDGFPLNPLDPEDAGGAEYAIALSTLLQAALGLTDGQRHVLEDALMMCYDECVPTLVELREKVREASMSELRSPAERREAEELRNVLGSVMSLRGAEKLTAKVPLSFSWMIEAPTVASLPSPKLAAVAQASLLAKALCLKAEGFLVLVEFDVFEKHGLLADVLRRLREKRVGVVALASTLSRGGEAVKSLGNRIVHRLDDGREMRLAEELMGLKEEEGSVQSERRHRLYQREVLRFLEWGEAVVQRSDTPHPVMVLFGKVRHVARVELEAISEVEGGRTPLEVDFGGDAGDALKVIQLIHDFPQVTLGQVVGGLPELGEKARELALRLADRGYLTFFRDGRGRKVFVVTRRGEEALRRAQGGR
ncbi:MAG: hypothetical protein QW225_08185 [Candidatus Jordarchaeales archaeon]